MSVTLNHAEHEKLLDLLKSAALETNSHHYHKILSILNGKSNRSRRHFDPVLEVATAQVTDLQDLPLLCAKNADSLRRNGFARLKLSDYTPPSKVYLTKSLYEPQRLLRTKYVRMKEGLWQVKLMPTPSKVPKIIIEEHSEKSDQEMLDAFKNPSCFSRPLHLTADLDEERSDDCQLGIPVLRPGQRLEDSIQHFPGIHTPYLYICIEAGAPFPLQVENGHLLSANLLHSGEPKVWVFIHSESMDVLENQLARLVASDRQPCSQFIRHHALFPSHELLHSWGVKFASTIQRAGELILINKRVYHYGFNCGPNIAQAINLAEMDYEPPLSYIDCQGWCNTDTAVSIQGIRRKEDPLQREAIQLRHARKLTERKKKEKKKEMNQSYALQRNGHSYDDDLSDAYVLSSLSRSPTAPPSTGVTELKVSELTISTDTRTMQPLFSPPNPPARSNIGNEIKKPGTITDPHTVSDDDDDDDNDNVTLLRSSIPQDLDCDDIGKICALVEWAKRQEKLAWLGDQLQGSDFDKQLGAFVPPGWLNDQVVFLLLNRLCATENVQVLDSLCTIDAVQRQDFGRLRLTATRVLIPICVESNHWCLMVCDKTTMTLITFEDKKYRETGILRSLIQRNVEGDWKEVSENHVAFYNNTHDCGVYVIAIAETLKMHAWSFETAMTEMRRIPNAGLQYRLRYLRILLNPSICAEPLQQTRVRFSKKRRLSKTDDSPRHRRRFLPSTAVNSTLAAAWVNFKEKHKYQEIDQILDLVVSIASPAVFQSLSQLLLYQRGLPQSFNLIQDAITLHRTGDIKASLNRLRKAWSALYIQEYLDQRTSRLQALMHTERAKRRRKAAAGRPVEKAPTGLKAQDRAVSEMAKDYVESTESIDCIQDYIRQMYREGKDFQKLSESLGIHYCLLPLTKINSPYSGAAIGYEEFVRFSKYPKEGIEVFRIAMKELRPDLASYPIAELNRLLTKTLDLTVSYRLESLKFEDLAVGCDEFKRCMDVVK